MVRLENLGGRCHVTGTEVLMWRVSLPLCEEWGGIHDFYRGLEERVVTFCEGDLRLWAEEEYERSDDPKKRFHFPNFSYRLEAEAHEADGVLKVTLSVTLRRKGEREPLSRWEQIHMWSVEEECLLPPPKVKKGKGKNSLQAQNTEKQ